PHRLEAQDTSSHGIGPLAISPRQNGSEFLLRGRIALLGRCPSPAPAEWGRRRCARRGCYLGVRTSEVATRDEAGGPSPRREACFSRIDGVGPGFAGRRPAPYPF